jgi:hypothetical protein
MALSEDFKIEVTLLNGKFIRSTVSYKEFKEMLSKGTDLFEFKDAGKEVLVPLTAIAWVKNIES